MLHSILVNTALFCEGADPNFLNNHRKIPKMTEDFLLPIISPNVHKNMSKISVTPIFFSFFGVFSSPLEHISTKKKLLHRPCDARTSLRWSNFKILFDHGEGVNLWSLKKPNFNTFFNNSEESNSELNSKCQSASPTLETSLRFYKHQ